MSSAVQSAVAVTGLTALGTHAMAIEYIRRGWAVIPWPRGTKGGNSKNWQDLRLDEATAPEHFPNGELLNIGVILGEPSGHLVDIDLDSEQAIRLADTFLPPTNAVFGRAGKPRSHRLYITSGIASLSFSFAGKMHIEIRAGGRQTIFPGSEHKSKELIEWDTNGEPASVTADRLETLVRCTAAASLLADHFPEKGTRDEVAMAVHGVLARAKWSVADAEAFVEAVALVGGADDPRSKANKADRTQRKHEAGSPTTGMPTLRRLIGDEVAKTFARWLRLDQRPTEQEVRDSIEGLSERSDAADVADVIANIGLARLGPLAVDEAIARVHKLTGQKVQTLKRQLKDSLQADDCADAGVALARELLRRHFAEGEHLIRVKDRSFWAYTGTHWERFPEEHIQKYAIAIATEQRAKSVSSVVHAAIDNLRGMQFREGDPLRLTREPLPVINCRNGELWIGDDGTATLRPHSADSFLTHVLHVEYDPAATAPLFDHALHGIFQRAKDRDGLIDFVWEFLGYAIQPRRTIPAWFMLYGIGRNGKTKLVQTIEHLVNQHAIVSQRIGDLEKSQFAVGELVGKLLLIDDDVDAGTKLPDGPLKKISERKLMTGQRKYGDNFEFIAHCLPVLLANNYPWSRDLSLGLRRRAEIIPFSHSFTPAEDDPTLFPRIWDTEMPGILNNAIIGLHRLFKRGRFAEQVDVTEAKRAWLAAANPLVAFIREECSSKPGLRCSLTEFFGEYTKWARDAGIKSPESRNQIGGRLEGLGYGLVEVNGRRHLVGVRPNELDGDDDEP